jgi:hypothetical protein
MKRHRGMLHLIFVATQTCAIVPFETRSTTELVEVPHTPYRSTCTPGPRRLHRWCDRVWRDRAGTISTRINTTPVRSSKQKPVSCPLAPRHHWQGQTATSAQWRLGKHSHLFTFVTLWCEGMRTWRLRSHLRMVYTVCLLVSFGPTG